MWACEAVYTSAYADAQQLTGLKKEDSKTLDKGDDIVTIKIIMAGN